MSIFTNVPARLNNTILTSPVMTVEVKFTWDNEEQCYVHHNEELLAGELFFFTQSTSCPSLWHFDWLLLDCDCDACLVADGEPTRLGTGNSGEIFDIALDEITARIAESVALNDPKVQFIVRLTLEN